MTTVEILREASTLIGRGWTQMADARDKYDIPCNWDAQQAVKFCLLGAVYRATSYYYDWDDEAEKEAVYLLQEAAGDCVDLTKWNDAPERTQIEVLFLIDAAIRAAEKEPQK